MRDSNPNYFDYPSAAREAGLSDVQLATILAALRCEEPTDDMLFELHVLRACRAMVGGPYTFAQIMESFNEDQASAA